MGALVEEEGGHKCGRMICVISGKERRMVRRVGLRKGGLSGS